MENTKRCTKCGRELSIEQFYKRSDYGSSIKYRAHCKDCFNIAVSFRQKNNPEKARITSAKWRQNNPDKAKIAETRWRGRNPEKCRTKRAAWRKNNPEKYRIMQARRRKRRRAHDLNFKLRLNVRAHIHSALKGNMKSDRTIRLLDCSIDDLRTHLEKQFQPGMTWSNYGLRGWHIDHIIPLSHFDFTDPEQQRCAWHYTNLQPLWAEDNIKKSNKIEKK